MFKKLWERIKHPRGVALIPVYIFTALCIAGAVVFCLIGQETDYAFVAYIFYAASALALGYSVYTVIIFAPKIKRKIIAKIRKYTFTNRLYEQYGFRTIVFTMFSLAISLVNALVNGTVGIIYLSLWYGALGAYYMLLSAMRGGILLHHRRDKKLTESETEEQAKLRELKTYRICGVLLVLLPLALSFAIAEMVINDMAFVRSGLMIYVSAAYTFYKIIMSVVNFFKARKTDEMTVRAVRNVNLADALVSVLALQTAMFHEFTENHDIGYSNAITGGIVCALTAALGVFMIVYGSVLIKRLKESKIANE